MYNPSSLKAEEFICHEEIMSTLDFAHQHKNDAALIDEIISKAKECKGLSHREALVLLDCDIPEKNQEIFKLAEDIKNNFMVTGLFYLHRCICQITV